MSQSKITPKNNCFDDITRDSILSKLMAREYFITQNKTLVTTLQYSDSLIFGLKSERSILKINEVKYKEVIFYKDTIIQNKNSIIKFEKKKGNKKAIKIGVAALLVGFLIGIGV